MHIGKAVQINCGNPKNLRVRSFIIKCYICDWEFQIGEGSGYLGEVPERSSALGDGRCRWGREGSIVLGSRVRDGTGAGSTGVVLVPSQLPLSTW